MPHDTFLPLPGFRVLHPFRQLAPRSDEWGPLPGSPTALQSDSHTLLFPLSIQDMLLPWLAGQKLPGVVSELEPS